MYLTAELEGTNKQGGFYFTKELKKRISKTTPSSSDTPCCLSACFCESPRYPNTLFELDPTTLTKMDAYVPRQSYVRLRHAETGTWVHSTFVKMDADAGEDSVMLKVGCSAWKEDKEAFAILPVMCEEVRDLDFANDSCKALADFLQHIRDGRSVVKEKSHVLELLTELIFFVTNTTNHLSDPLKLKALKPLRNRQKLLREQKVLQQIFELLRAPFMTFKDRQIFESPSVLSRPGNESFKRMFQLMYTLLRFSQQSYRRNQVYIAERFIHIQQQIGYGLMAEDTITAILHDNTKLLETYVEKAHIEKFIELVRNNSEGKFLDYLTLLCVCKGEANKRIQELICESVLSKSNMDILVRTTCVKGEVYLQWCNKEAVSLRSVAENAMKSSEEQTLLNYYRHQLDLFSQMCLDRQFLAINPPVNKKLLNLSKELTVDTILQCMCDETLPFDLRASFARLMLHLHVVTDLQQVIPVRYARLWKDISSSVSIMRYKNQELMGLIEENQRLLLSSDRFNGLLRYVEKYLKSLKDSKFLIKEQNALTLEIVMLTRALVNFGFFKLYELLCLARDLLNILDNSSVTKKIQVVKALQRPNNLLVPLKQIAKRPLSNADLEMSEEDKRVVLQCKLNIIDIITVSMF
ncbi:unnamed protein product [Soboliphyme baturini]|uniref:Inositol 1,4,5-trisphosphate receptor n=1 Tax=Soboliphyme baturini TaxID=241478 RepID=A0A183IWS2_9BILA|nr:unnamed protein product [Soboliphyme baturini]